ncbi:hypothetical protein, partial [Embleya sp. NPDC005575]|uniref:hypothetical protein n=1 Tax=Embleya sp. NPDC005575 TaxID=3156892 RepID=UPI0033B8ADB1
GGFAFLAFGFHRVSALSAFRTLADPATRFSSVAFRLRNFRFPDFRLFELSRFGNPFPPRSGRLEIPKPHAQEQQIAQLVANERDR